MHWPELLQRALSLSVPYSFDPDGKLSAQGIRGTPSAVLILLEPSLFDGSQTSLLDCSVVLTRRSEFVEHHKGQISFPGGTQDPEDEQRGGLRATALREAHEELGIDPAHVEIFGELPQLPTVTGFTIAPVVALPSHLAPSVPLRAEPKTAETAEVFRATLRGLDAPGIWKREWVEHRTGSGLLLKHPIDSFYWNEHRIWGATGAMLKNLIERLKQVEEIG